MARKPARRNNRNQNNGSPGFALLVIGFVLGVFVSVATYFAIGGPEQKVAKSKEEQQVAQANQEPELKFEFHSILPELEVVIPEQFTEKLREVLPESKPESEQQDAGTTTSETAAQPSGETYFIQAGSFKKSEDAERMKIKLLLLGLDVNVQPVNVQGVQYHRVRIGPLTDYRSFEKARDRLKENNVQYMVLKSRG